MGVHVDLYAGEMVLTSSFNQLRPPSVAMSVLVICILNLSTNTSVVLPLKHDVILFSIFSVKTSIEEIHYNIMCNFIGLQLSVSKEITVKTYN